MINWDCTGTDVLVVDDSEPIRKLIGVALNQIGCRCHAVSDAGAALNVLAANAADVVLVDVSLPGENGLSLCRRLKTEAGTRLTPVIVISGRSDNVTRLLALEAGADDFLTKPLSLLELKARVRSAARLSTYVNRLDDAQAALVMLASSIESRDVHTSGHCRRIADLAESLGRRIGLDEEKLVLLQRGGLMHDIGKIGIPDSILLKIGRLTPVEYETVKTHTVLGDQLCAPLQSMQTIRPIVRSHHERLDGSGYPDRLRGRAIPLMVQIVSIVDVFDALTSNRPYRGALGPSAALDVLRHEAVKGMHDAQLVDALEPLVTPTTDIEFPSVPHVDPKAARAPMI